LGRIGGDNVRDCGRRILNALMTTDVAITLNWKGINKSFEALNVCALGRQIQTDLVFKSARLPLTKTFFK
jgi:hypothetical protein